jgi:hypothetical protein
VDAIFFLTLVHKTPAATSEGELPICEGALTASADPAARTRSPILIPTLMLRLLAWIRLPASAKRRRILQPRTPVEAFEERRASVDRLVPILNQLRKLILQLLRRQVALACDLPEDACAIFDRPVAARRLPMIRHLSGRVQESVGARAR